MGSTGKVGITKESTRTDERNLKIGNSVLFEGQAPKESGLGKHTGEDIQIRAKVSGEKDIIFQFKLTKDNRMSIRAWDPNIPSKSAVTVSTNSPSLNSVPASQKAAAGKIRDMMNKSKSGVTESSLPSIAQELVRKKTQQGGK